MRNGIISFLNLIRWKNLAIIMVTQILTRYFLVDDNPIIIGDNVTNYKLPLILISTALIAAAGYIINDYFDIKIDLINKPNEVYVGRTISRRKALLTHQIFSGIGIAIGFLLGLKIFLLNIFAVTILWFYASVFKKKPFSGNFLVAILSALCISEIGFYYTQNTFIIHTYAIFAFFITLIREIIKDLEDMAGDKIHGAKTLPIKFGLRNTKKLLYIIIFIFSLVVIILSIYIGNKKLWLFFGVLAIFMLGVVYKLILADRKTHFSALSRLCKYIMILGILSMVLL